VKGHYVNLISVYDAYEEFLALSVRDMLRENGIGAMIQSEQLAGYNFNLINAGGAWGRVLVDSGDAAKAMELIAGFQGTLGELAEARQVEEVTES